MDDPNNEGSPNRCCCYSTKIIDRDSPLSFIGKVKISLRTIIRVTVSIHKCQKENCKNPALFPYLYCEKCLGEFEAEVSYGILEKDK
jgi:hypothetical protein